MKLMRRVTEPVKTIVDGIKLKSHYVKHLARSMRLDTSTPIYKDKLIELDDFEAKEEVEDLKEVML